MNKPIIINDKIINNFEEFQKFFLQNRSTKKKAIEFLKKKLDALEKKISNIHSGVYQYHCRYASGRYS